jgi:hypothetical protein
MRAVARASLKIDIRMIITCYQVPSSQDGGRVLGVAGLARHQLPES